MITETPARLICRVRTKTSSCSAGDRPADGSSSSSTEGSIISARPIATICRSPPDSEPARWARRSPSAGLSPVRQDETFINVAEINRAGVSVLIVEQNARRALQICDRGYVLDQGRNAYTDTGDSLMNDPKVIELYLGTLAKA